MSTEASYDSFHVNALLFLGAVGTDVALNSPGKLPDPVGYKCTGSSTSNPIMHRANPNYFKFLTAKLQRNVSFCCKFLPEYHLHTKSHSTEYKTMH